MKYLIALFLTVIVVISSSAFEYNVIVTPGPSFKERSNPQIAVWIEDTEGKFIRTSYVTRRAGLSKWRFAPDNGRPESLPVWMGKSNASECKNDFDVISGATPKKSFSFTFDSTETCFVIKAEVNNSFDYNSFYTKKNSGVNGQPSVVYEGFFDGKVMECELLFTGCGSLDGKDGEIHKEENLTTAKNIIERIIVIKK